MTTLDPYGYLTNQEFLWLFKDRIPEDLLPKIERVFEDFEAEQFTEEILGNEQNRQ